MPTWLEAGLWGLLGGGALVIGALIAWFAPVPRKVVASVMAFGSGVLISAVAFDLMEEAARTGGLRRDGVRLPRRRGRVPGGEPGARPPRRPAPEAVGGPAAVRVRSRPAAGWRSRSGALLDGVPESVVLGLGLVGGGSVSLSVLAAVFISNVPEGLSSAAGMKRSGRSARYVFGVWGGIAVASGLSALLGYAALGGASPEAVAVITAVAAGAILTMIADTMIPEAFEDTHAWTGLITTVGFLTAFAISARADLSAAGGRRAARAPGRPRAGAARHRVGPDGEDGDVVLDPVAQHLGEQPVAQRVQRDVGRAGAGRRGPAPRPSSSGTPRRSNSPSVNSSSVLPSGSGGRSVDARARASRCPAAGRPAPPGRRRCRRPAAASAPDGRPTTTAAAAGPAPGRRRPAPRGRPGRSPSRARPGRPARGRPGAARRPAPPGGRRRCPGPAS